MCSTAAPTRRAWGGGFGGGVTCWGLGWGVGRAGLWAGRACGGGQRRHRPRELGGKGAHAPHTPLRPRGKATHRSDAASSSAVLSDPGGAAVVFRNRSAASRGPPRLSSLKPGAMGPQITETFSSPLLPAGPNAMTGSGPPRRRGAAGPRSAGGSRPRSTSARCAARRTRVWSPSQSAGYWNSARGEGGAGERGWGELGGAGDQGLKKARGEARCCDAPRAPLPCACSGPAPALQAARRPPLSCRRAPKPLAASTQRLRPRTGTSTSSRSRPASAPPSSASRPLVTPPRLPPSATAAAVERPMTALHRGWGRGGGRAALSATAGWRSRWRRWRVPRARAPWVGAQGNRVGRRGRATRKPTCGCWGSARPRPRFARGRRG
jgi:hypothetical protein